MPALKNIFLAVLLSTVASGVKGNSTTVTLFDVVDTGAAGRKVVDMSAISVESNGGTAYVEKIETVVTTAGAPFTTTVTGTLVEAASWLYFNVVTAGVGLQENCTVGTNVTTGECLGIVGVASDGVGTFTTTATGATGQVVPLYTLTVTGPTPTSSSAATVLDNPIFNRLPSFVGGILFILMFF